MPKALSKFLLVCAAAHNWQDFANYLVSTTKVDGALIEWQAKDRSALKKTWGAGRFAPSQADIIPNTAPSDTTWMAVADTRELRLSVHLDLSSSLAGKSHPITPLRRALRTSLYQAAEIAAAARNKIIAAVHAGALHSCSLPAFIVDANAAVVGMNAQARAELAAGSGDLKMTASSILHLSSTDATRALAEAARLHSSELVPSPSFCVLRDGDHKIKGILFVTRRSISEVSVAPPFVMVCFVPLARMRPMRDNQLKEAFGLTSSEAALANAIGSGASVKTYATTLGVSESTVRWHLHNVLQSVDVENQIELARVFFALQTMNA